MTTNSTSIRWTRRVRSVLSSVADVTGDWFYYQFLLDRDDIPNLNDDILDPIFFVIVLSSTFFSFMSILVMGLGCPQAFGMCTRQRKFCGFSAPTWVALLEVIMEDIPQLVITTLVSYHLRGPLSAQAVFNLTTSSINFVLDVLDIGDDIMDERAAEEETDNADNHRTNNRESQTSQARWY